MPVKLDKASKKAEALLKSPRKRARLLDAAAGMASTGKYTLPISGMTGKIKTMVRMVGCTVSREYQGIPWQSIVFITAALIYFVSPFDALADFLPLIGFIDDAAIISAVFASIGKDIEKFNAWEAEKSASPTALISSAESE